MNEEQAVLDFFAQKENLPLALSVAEQVDATRRHMNNDFWRELGKYVEGFSPEWRVQLTEDRNTEDCLVGLHLQPTHEQALYLCPMLEQQTIGETARIYLGLIWSSPPPPDLTSLPAISKLRSTLQGNGFSSNEKFLAWQWTPLYPRSKNFLLRFSTAAETILNEASSLLQQVIATHGTMLSDANSALQNPQRSTVISLDTLRNNLKRQ